MAPVGKGLVENLLLFFGYYWVSILFVLCREVPHSVVRVCGNKSFRTSEKENKR